MTKQKITKLRIALNEGWRTNGANLVKILPLPKCAKHFDLVVSLQGSETLEPVPLKGSETLEPL